MVREPPWAESYEPVVPPSIRVPEEVFRRVEFYVSAQAARPEVELLTMVRDWVASQPPINLGSLDIQVHFGTPEEPPMLIGLLTVGEPLDVG
jgi:hypothetical protein